MDAIKYYVKGVFQGVEATAESREQQEELIADLEARVDDLVAQGRCEQVAIAEAIDSLGDLSQLVGEFRTGEEAADAGPVPRRSQWKWLVAASFAVLLVASPIVALGVLPRPLLQRLTSRAIPNQPAHDLRAMQREYLEAAAELTLPPGVSFPAEANAGEDPETSTYGTGYGMSWAQSYWAYAWEMEWLAQRTKNPARAREALSVLSDEVPRREFMTTYMDQNGRDMWAEYVRQAEKGDPSGFQQDVSANPMPLVGTGD